MTPQPPSQPTPVIILVWVLNPETLQLFEMHPSNVPPGWTVIEIPPDQV